MRDFTRQCLGLLKVSGVCNFPWGIMATAARRRGTATTRNSQLVVPDPLSSCEPWLLTGPRGRTIIHRQHSKASTMPSVFDSARTKFRESEGLDRRQSLDARADLIWENGRRQRWQAGCRSSYRKSTDCMPAPCNAQDRPTVVRCVRRRVQWDDRLRDRQQPFDHTPCRPRRCRKPIRLLGQRAPFATTYTDG